jgi:hypothetical protein
VKEGAVATDRVARFLGNAGLIPKPTWNEQPVQSAPKKKATAPFMRTKRGCRGGRKRQRPISPISKVSSTEAVDAALSED